LSLPKRSIVTILMIFAIWSLLFWIVLSWSLCNLIILPLCIVYQKNNVITQYGLYLFFSILFIIYGIGEHSLFACFYAFFNCYVILFVVFFFQIYEYISNHKTSSRGRKEQMVLYMDNIDCIAKM